MHHRIEALKPPRTGYNRHAFAGAVPFGQAELFDLACPVDSSVPLSLTAGLQGYIFSLRTV